MKTGFFVGFYASHVGPRLCEAPYKSDYRLHRHFVQLHTCLSFQLKVNALVSTDAESGCLMLCHFRNEVLQAL